MYMLQQYSSHEKIVKREIRINLEIYTFKSVYLLANSAPAGYNVASFLFKWETSPKR